MSEVSDAFDLAIGALFIGLMLVMCAWAVTAYKSAYVRQVDEKTAVHVVEVPYLEDGTGNNPFDYIHKAVYTGRDCIAALMVADSFCPEPQTVTFKTSGGGTIFTATFNTSWYTNKEVNMSNANAALGGYMNSEVAKAECTASSWIVTFK